MHVVSDTVIIHKLLGRKTLGVVTKFSSEYTGMISSILRHRREGMIKQYLHTTEQLIGHELEC